MQFVNPPTLYAWHPTMNQHVALPADYSSYFHPVISPCTHCVPCGPYVAESVDKLTPSETMTTPPIDMIDFTFGNNPPLVYPSGEFFSNEYFLYPQAPPTPALSVNTVTGPSWSTTPPADAPTKDEAPKTKSRRKSRRTAAVKTSPRKSRASSDSNQVSELYECPQEGCGKSFTRPYNLTSHMRTHTLDRPFPCTQCGRRFARQHDRNRHEKLHWGIKPYKCHHCQKSFARVDALGRHLRVENGCGSFGH